MSEDTWLAEFYPTQAIDFRGEEKTIENQLAAAQHSLQKWRGALPENLEKHGIVKDDEFYFLSVAGIRFADDSCALCHINHNPSLGSSDCDLCPITLSGGKNCNCAGSPFRASCVNPKPMIKALEKAIIWLKEQ